MDIIGIGSPLVDVVAQVEDAWLQEHAGGSKGGMEMVESEASEQLIAAITSEPTLAPGGAAANTTVGCANLGLDAAFVGAVGGDQYGAFFKQSLERQRCQDRMIERKDVGTGRVVSLVTPDAERTMRTCLGAAATLSPEDISSETFAGARVVMLEGYTLFNHDLTRAIAAAVSEAGAQLAFDMASFEVVAANKAIITELLDQYRPIVFANEDEAAAWIGDEKPEDALEDLASRCAIAVVKLGKDGALIARDGERYRVDALPDIAAVDTTGAGDTWAAGFLAGYLKGLDLEACGRLGAQTGAAVVQVMGAQLNRETWLGLRGQLDAWCS